MRTKGLIWLGTCTQNLTNTVEFFRDVLGLEPAFEESQTAELSMENGDRIQLFAPGHPYFKFFTAHASGPVPLFEVDDLDTAKHAILDAGLQLVGEVDADEKWLWLTFRAPDGNLYELASPR
jgi:catechol 2,3-dioxygenase-like lactoylglutathione lyase family enzyme